jgi:nucleotide-binding universal stress UspA family protein
MAKNEIIVGADGSEGSVAALQWAVDHAALAGARVVVVTVWEYPYTGDFTGSVTPPSRLPMEEGARATAQHVIDKVANPTGVAIDVEVVEGSASSQLIHRAADASMLVVGARGHGGFVSLLLGSVATQCVNHASVPVVVVPSGDRGH